MKKIPDNARKVFEGLIFDVYHWEQEMFDGTTSTFEAIRRGDSVTVLALEGNTILVNEEIQPGRTPFLALPGGRVDKGEDIMSAARRELLEETGMVSKELIHWFTVDASDMAKIEWSSHYFIAKNCTKETEVSLDAGEKIVTKHFTLDELIENQNRFGNRNSGIRGKLEEAKNNSDEKQKLKELLGITS